MTEGDALRIGSLDGAPARVVAGRQSRPDRPADDCPFCPGGSAAPDDYDVHWFVNNWPPLPDGRAEVLLHHPDHDTSFADLSPEHARRVVDLWADRSQALGSRDDVAYVLVFENRGAAVGATIDHPHGQVYAFTDVPPAAATEYDSATEDAFAIDPRLLVTTVGSWSASVPTAPKWPFELLLAPDIDVPDLPSLDDARRDELAVVLVDIIGRLDALFDEPMPYMRWIHQRPFDGVVRRALRVHVHIAPLLRSPGTPRFVAAGELGSGVWFDPVEPVDAATRLRQTR